MWKPVFRLKAHEIKDSKPTSAGSAAVPAPGQALLIPGVPNHAAMAARTPGLAVRAMSGSAASAPAARPGRGARAPASWREPGASSGQRRFVSLPPTDRRHVACREGADQKRDESPESHIDAGLAGGVRGLLGLVRRLGLGALRLIEDVGDPLLGVRLAHSRPAGHELSEIGLVRVGKIAGVERARQDAPGLGLRGRLIA